MEKNRLGVDEVNVCFKSLMEDFNKTPNLDHNWDTFVPHFPLEVQETVCLWVGVFVPQSEFHGRLRQAEAGRGRQKLKRPDTDIAKILKQNVYISESPSNFFK